MGNEIIGRIQEKKILQKVFDSRRAEFIAIYGRRRVGKTYLVRQFFANKSCYYFQITGVKNGSMKEQLHEFTRTVEKTFYQKGTTLKEPSTWMQAFEILTNAIAEHGKKKKIVLFFDELPWLATRRSRILQALDYYWNTKWNDNSYIRLIVCGSAASWIIKNIVNNRSGLHNRITEKIRLDPFSLNESKNFLKYCGVNLTEKQVLILYMVMGGIPHYLKQVERGLSATQIIDKLCFTKDGLLFEEYKNLIPSLFNEAEIYNSLVKLIAANHYGIERSDLLKKSKLPSGGRFNLRLMELEEAGFIFSFKPHGHVRRGQYYRIIDEYTLFYLNWIEPIKGSIRNQKKPRGYWDAYSKSSGTNWFGYAFESVCYKHIANIREALKIPVTAEEGTWRFVPRKNSIERGAQIDLLFDRKDGVITICEIKYSDGPFKINKEDAIIFRNKMEVYKQQTHTDKQLFFAMITSSGIKENIYSQELVSAQSNLSDLFNE